MKFDQLSKYWLVFAMRSLLVLRYRMDTFSGIQSREDIPHFLYAYWRSEGLTLENAEVEVSGSFLN